MTTLYDAATPDIGEVDPELRPTLDDVFQSLRDFHDTFQAYQEDQVPPVLVKAEPNAECWHYAHLWAIHHMIDELINRIEAEAKISQHELAEAKPGRFELARMKRAALNSMTAMDELESISERVENGELSYAEGARLALEITAKRTGVPVEALVAQMPPDTKQGWDILQAGGGDGDDE